MFHSLLDLFAREHPAFVHVPVGLVIVLPLAMLASFRSPSPETWKRTSFFLALLAWGGSSLALLSGLFWGRLIALIPAGGFVPKVNSGTQVLQKMLQRHEFAALAGLVLGLVCLLLLWRTLRNPEARNVGAGALVAGVLWAGAWAITGRLGGIMVFGNEETNKAAAAADAARRDNAEADLPIRALDYASLEPVQPEPVRIKAHGNRWGRVWVTASGIDAYKAGKPLPIGAYAVLNTFEDEKGKPSHEPGPLYMKETRSDGGTAFAFYWARVPEKMQAEVGGDSVYWRSPDRNLATCLGCHESGATASK